MELDVRIENHEQRIVSAEHRIKDLEETQKQINELTISVKELALSVKNMTEEQKNQKARLTELESKPAKRWESAITTIIGYLLTAGLGYLIAMAIK